MAKQQVVLVDRNDRKLGVEEKLKAHQKNLKHRAFSIFSFNQKNQLLLQKRNKNKYHSGGLWSNTCCSHPAIREETAKAAKRQLKEEMGISCSLKEIFSFNYQTKLGKIFENEFDHVFIGRYNGNPKPDPKEAEAWQWIDLKELKADIKRNPKKYTYWFREVIENYSAKIYNHLQAKNPYCQTTQDTINFFLPSAGCAKAKKSGPCAMCVFYQPWKILKTSPQKPTNKKILALYKKYILPAINFTQTQTLNLFIGGSILDEKEFPFEFIVLIFKNLPSSIKEIVIESRPEYITDEILMKLKNILPKNIKLVIYLGVETMNEKYRQQILKKEISNQDIADVLKKIKKYNIKAGAYLLAGLPYLSKKESILEARKSIKWCLRVRFDQINLCPTVVPQEASILKTLWQKKKFKPLNLKEIIKIIKGCQKYPLIVAELENDPPAIAGLEGSAQEKEYIFNFNQRI
ncbi:MAG: hypothetical protein CEN92_55 [Candidatus Berkelbacteria bacterium Licking1014_96]|uniref:Isopentenyl-diphosphate delta-isomerase n=1 Tax=Candidatus Berkelbacteria bacterium Licking1014_96 TaxID=2017149 RepID=A0A554LH86_9BACT|nr:MAG: hypothetical protein CEN92_55 [Candidatus Berkelbacteria bacterium Licking1014_96]